MIEFLIYALLSEKSADFFAKTPPTELPAIEILEPRPTPLLSASPTSVAPNLLENPDTAVLALDANSGKSLFEKSTSRAQPIASLTKLMTALIILEEHDFDEEVTVSPAANRAPGASIDLYSYEKISVQTLLEAILIGSANDAAVALAIHNADSEAEFVIKMNRRAQDLGLISAEFFNATGLDVFEAENRKFKGNLMSAHDVAKLARIMLRNDFVRTTVQKEKFVGQSSDGEFFHAKDTTNELLGTSLNLKGLKTGYTDLAGQCFVSFGETSTGHEVLTVILGSEDRFGETAKLLQWVYRSF